MVTFGQALLASVTLANCFHDLFEDLFSVHHAVSNGVDIQHNTAVGASGFFNAFLTASAPTILLLGSSFLVFAVAFFSLFPSNVQKRATFFFKRSFFFKYVLIAGEGLPFHIGVPTTIKS